MTPTTTGAHPAPDPREVHGSIFDGLVGSVGDVGQWAFGTDFDDPLAGIDTRVSDGIDATVLARYTLALADDALVASHRLSQWCGAAPDLEDDIALANIALDLLGQARLLLIRAAAADPSLVPPLPSGSPVPAEDALAFFRSPSAYTNVRLVEVGNGDFAHTVVRLLVTSTVRLAVLTRLRSSADPVLAAVATKGVKELAYHRDYAARWFVTLAGGTAESADRLGRAVADLWPLCGELVEPHPVEQAAAAGGFGVDPAQLAPEVGAVLDEVFAAARLERPPFTVLAGVRGRRGRDGLHTEAMSLLLAEMQSVAREHPLGQW